MIGLLQFDRVREMDATVIDTLRFADQLKAAGFEAPQAEGMARALGDQLADRMVTRNDLNETERAISARFDALEPRFDAIDAKFDAIDSKFDAIDSKFDAIDSKFDAIDAKFDAKFDALDAKIESVHREFSGKFNVLTTVMALGFTLLVGLGTYNAVAPRIADRTGQVPATHQQTIDAPDERTSDSGVRTGS